MSTISPQSQHHLLNLIAKEAKGDGWAIVSDPMWPLVMKIPSDFVQLRQLPTGGLAKLTEEGAIVAKFLGNGKS